ncbi:MAG TPA: alternative ribosome rescue aminoacyl-tRNA hydrolase ArfB [Gammaproteobacteria bacterium]|nr:alternative ribosome rescue aminoacyl-tRNA hydrolase ArfB [Gammaproteobacteria bacterium]
MLEITPHIHVHEDELLFRFVRASGPGGQNVNKVATAAELRFDIKQNISLPEPVRARLIKLAANKINSQGELLIFAQRYRTQERNRADAIERLVTLLRRAAEIPKVRKHTRPTRASKRRRLDGKRRLSSKKRLRGGSEDY